MMLWKCFNKYASTFGKLSSGHRTGKCQFSFQSLKRQCQRRFKLPHNCSYLCTSKVMLNILHARLQQYVNCVLPNVQAGFKKGTGPRDIIANICWIIEKARAFQKNIYCFTDYTKTFDCVGHNWGRFLKRWEYQTTLPASWETCMQVKKQQLELDMEQWIHSKSRGVHQDCILSPCLLNFYVDTSCKCRTEWSTNWNQDCWEKYQ